jgi:hypothetical protein
VHRLLLQEEQDGGADVAAGRSATVAAARPTHGVVVSAAPAAVDSATSVVALGMFVIHVVPFVVLTT